MALWRTSVDLANVLGRLRKVLGYVCMNTRYSCSAGRIIVMHFGPSIRFDIRTWFHFPFQSLQYSLHCLTWSPPLFPRGVPLSVGNMLRWLNHSDPRTFLRKRGTCRWRVFHSSRMWPGHSLYMQYRFSFLTSDIPPICPSQCTKIKNSQDQSCFLPQYSPIQSNANASQFSYSAQSSLRSSYMLDLSSSASPHQL